MNQTTPQYANDRPAANAAAGGTGGSTGFTGFMIAAIGLQLLLCSAASAAQICTGTLDRTFDRIETSLVEALREIADRQIEQNQPTMPIMVYDPGSICLNAPVDEGHEHIESFDAPGVERLGLWLLSLPPPVVC
tara:strand:- start:262524 stop:262925 length:402 start_codon:yes stop_codon:yes gene_type:complete